MNRNGSFVSFLPLFIITLAAGGPESGCATRTDDRSPAVKHKDAPGFYQAFTNHAGSPLSKPTGPFPVGRVDRLLTDTSRNILYRTVTNGSLMTTIWYPAAEGCNRSPAPYVNLREMTAWVELFRQYGQRWDASQVARLTNCRSYSFLDAPLAPRPRRFPVVLYVHGQVGLRTDNSGSAEELASHGFIVVSSAHGGTAGMELPDGTLVKPKPQFHLSGSDTNPVAVAVFQDQTRDLQFLIAELGRLNATDPLFAGRLDLSRLGVFGFSYGGASAAELCNVDPRCKAGAALDPGGHPDFSTLRLKQPFMILAGPHGVSGGARRLFDQLTGEAYFIKIRNAAHAEFSDAAGFLYPSNTGRPQAIVRTYLVAFFAKYLNHAHGHELDGPLPDHQEIEVFTKK